MFSILNRGFVAAAFSFLFIGVPQLAWAGGQHETTIDFLLVHKAGGKVFVYFDAPFTNPPACGAGFNNRTVFLMSDLGSEAIYSMLLTARIQNLPVTFTLVDTCGINPDTQDVTFARF